MYSDEIKEINKVWHVLIERFQRTMEDEKYSHINELSTTEISILQLLNDYPQIILKEICARLNIPKSTLTSAVNRLVKKGYVERISTSCDKRAFSLYITEKGAAIQKDHLELEYSCVSQILDRLDRTEVETLLRLLKKSIEGEPVAYTHRRRQEG